MNIINFENWSSEPIESQITAQPIDMIEIEGKDYLVTLVNDQLNTSETNVDVREVLQDWYCNGNYITYANAAKSGKCEEIEAIFNRSKIKEKLIRRTWRPYDILDAMEMDVRLSALRPVYDPQISKIGCVGIINKEDFETKKTLLEHIDVGNKSACQLQATIEYYANPKQLKKKKYN